MFSQVLKRLRNDAKLTQSELASKLKISTSTIGMYESDKRMPDVETIKVIADFFDVSVDYLLERENTQSNDVLKKDITNYNSYMENLEVSFMGASENDKDKIYSTISKLYWKYKEMDDKKHNH